jgi:uncharacterized protein YaiE (UPF0345 family)
MRGLFALSVIVLACGCSKKQPAAVNKSAQVASPKTVATFDPNDKHGTRKLMGLDVPVFVDGVQRGVLRAGDLPQIAGAKAWNGAAGWRLYDYLAAIGVAPESAKAVHLYGNGQRVGGVTGAELAHDKDRFVFSFVSGDTGTPIARWDTTGLQNTYVVHEIRRVAVYSAKPVPKLDADRLCVLEGTACTDAIPYGAEAAKGTRVYVDGKMVGFVKRRQLGEALVVGKTEAGEPKFSVAKLVASFGASADGAQGVELVAGDDVVARADGAQWAKLGAGMYFTSPQHSHGKVRVNVPAALQSPEDTEKKDRDALVTAVHVYKRTAPTKRELVSISDETDLSVQLASATARDEASAGQGHRGEDFGQRAQ